MSAETTQIELPRYQSHKKVHALKIDRFARVGDGIVCIWFVEGETYGPVYTDDKIAARYEPKHGDYYVVYDDGFKSISPAKAFEEGYTRIDGAALGVR